MKYRLSKIAPMFCLLGVSSGGSLTASADAYEIFGQLATHPFEIAGDLPVDPVSGLPLLNSNPDAMGVAYLDFDGGMVFGSQRVAYGGDGTFNSTEQSEIYTAWRDVAVHFAMFDINVTTVAPNKNVTPTAHVIITPDFDGGAANTGFFGNTNSIARGAVQDTYVTDRSTVITHELGHIMGLGHQSSYYANGTRNEEYGGPDEFGRGLMMGRDANGKFTTWADSFTGTNRDPQDDIAFLQQTIISTYNSFCGNDYSGDGFRLDEHGNTQADATELTWGVHRWPDENGDPVYTTEAAGIIERYSDKDVFSFGWGGGSEFIIAAVASPNLAAPPDFASSLGIKLTLTDEDGIIVSEDGQSDPADVAAAIDFSTETGSSFNLEPGVYFLTVESTQDYEDLGAYTLTLLAQTDRQPPDVPEPTSACLLLGCVIGLGLRRRRACV